MILAIEGEDDTYDVSFFLIRKKKKLLKAKNARPSSVSSNAIRSRILGHFYGFGPLSFSPKCNTRNKQGGV